MLRMAWAKNTSCRSSCAAFHVLNNSTVYVLGWVSTSGVVISAKDDEIVVRIALLDGQTRISSGALVAKRLNVGDPAYRYCGVVVVGW